VNPKERFWKKVDKRGPDECWEWRGSVSSSGYGSIYVYGSAIRIHRFSYELHNGPIPEGEGYHGTCVCHTCDNRRCVNPGHLFLGTHAENMADMKRKGRQKDVAGEANPRAKLTPDDVENIRANAMNLPRQDIADLFGVSKSLVEKILAGAVWA